MSGVAAALTRYGVLDADKTALCTPRLRRRTCTYFSLAPPFNFGEVGSPPLSGCFSAPAPIVEWIARHAPVGRHPRLQRTPDARHRPDDVARSLPEVSKEIIVVDDCSNDGTRDWLQANFGDGPRAGSTVDLDGEGNLAFAQELDPADRHDPPDIP